MAMRSLVVALSSKRKIYKLIVLLGVGVFILSVLNLKDNLVISRKDLNYPRAEMSMEERFLKPKAKPELFYQATYNDPADDTFETKDRKVEEFNERLSKRCEELNLMSQYNSTPAMRDLVKSLRNILVVENHKLLFCYVPKVACTNWKRLLLMLKGVREAERIRDHMKIHISADANLRTISSFSFEEAMSRLQNYTKIMFVREPFTRLLSAYRDKMETTGRIDSSRFRKTFGAKMKKIQAKKAMEFNVTFYDFASYLADPQNLLDKYEDEHWSPIFKLCQPCAVKYDFIGKMENLQTDTLYSLTKVVQSNLDLKLLNSTNFTNSSNVQLLQKYYSRIPLQTIRDLYNKFRPDFELFGYPFPWFAVDDFYFSNSNIWIQ